MLREAIFTTTLIALVGCGGSGNVDDSTRALVTKGKHMLLQSGENGTAEILKGKGRTLITDFSESDHGVGIVTENCQPPGDACEAWRISVNASTTKGGYWIGASDIDGAGSIRADDYIYLSVLPADPAPAAQLNDAILSPPGHTGLAAGASHSLVIAEDGTLWGWGNHESGRLGSARISGNLNDPTPKQIPGLSDVVQVAAGRYHSLVVTADGIAYGFGSNGYGQLGDTTENDSRFPRQVDALTNVDHVSAGIFHSLALVVGNSGNRVYAWGSDSYGQLGQGGGLARLRSDRPLEVSISTPVQVAAGDHFSLALDAAGSVWFWGDLGGNGSISDSDAIVPIQISGLQNIVRISAGGSHALALRDDGTVWAWGNNGFGELGQNNQTDSGLTPLQVSGLTNIVDITAGGNISAALSRNGDLYSWGSNVGRSGNALVPEPVVLHSSAPVVDIEAGSGHLLALVADCTGGGTLRSWGGNYRGQLGDGTFMDKDRPSIVIGIGEAESTCHKRALFYKSGYNAKSANVIGSNMQCNNNLCWSMVDSTVTNQLPISFEFTDENTGFSKLIWDCAGLTDNNGTPFNLTVNDDVYCKLVTEETPSAPSRYALTVVIEGGPNAGQVVSGEEYFPTMDCVNRNESTTTCTEYYPIGSQVSLSGASANGLELSWSGCTPGLDENNQPVCTLTMDSDHTVTARFSSPPPSSHTLTVIIEGGPGAGEVRSGEIPVPQLDCINSSEPTTSCTTRYAAGSDVVLYGNAFASSVLSWSGCTPGLDALEQPICQLTMDSDRVVVATFTPTHTLSLTIAGQPSPGTVIYSNEVPLLLYCVSPDDSGTTCNANFPHDADVLLSWNNHGGFPIQSWSGCTPELNANNQLECRLTMDGDHSVTATFGP